MTKTIKNLSVRFIKALSAMTLIFFGTSTTMFGLNMREAAFTIVGFNALIVGTILMNSAFDMMFIEKSIEPNMEGSENSD